jgi:UDPglucose 6-dehydrogenase
MRITVIGTGYVGLVAGACFAETGNTVFCVDNDPNKIDALLRGEIPIYEPGLDPIVKRGINNGRLHFTTSTSKGMEHAEIVFLAVGTPPLPNGDPDLKYLKAASEEVGKAMTRDCVVVNKSTVPVGSHRQVAEWIKPHAKHQFEVVSNPEFLKEGTAIDDFLKPDRVVIGTDREEAFQKMAYLYSPFVRQGNPVIWMDPISAELTKYACNSFLATRISFMNELAVLCDKVGGDVEKVRKGMTTDVRIGKHFLYAGVGYGGSCFPKDVQAIMSTAKKQNVEMGIVTAAEEANARQKRYMTAKVKAHLGTNLKGKTFGVWGLAFKPNTDDMREAPAVTIIEELLECGASIRVFDPVATENARKMLGDKVTYCNAAYDAIEGADALLLVTEWNEFRHPDFQKIKAMMKFPIVFDGRNIYDPKEMHDQGFMYFGVGRGSHTPKNLT